jgi:hypothetical protein
MKLHDDDPASARNFKILVGMTVLVGLGVAYATSGGGEEAVGGPWMVLLVAVAAGGYFGLDAMLTQGSEDNSP